MRHTFSQGVPMMEFDLHESSEGTIFPSHDKTLDRTTNAKGSIAGLSDAQLSRVDQVDPLSHAPVEPLARFEELLGWARGNTVALMVDLKDTPPADAVAAIRQHGLLGRVVLLAFDAKTAAAAMAADSGVLVSVLASSKEQIDAAITGAKGHPMALYLPGSADASLFAYARTTGKPVITDALGALDDQAAAQGPAVYRAYLASHPADILVTNHAKELQQALQAAASGAP